MKVFAIFLFAMANIWQVVYGEQSPNDRELWAKVPRPGQNVCIKPWQAGGHVLFVTGTKYIPVGGRFTNTWTSDAFIMRGWFMSEDHPGRVLDVNVQMQNLLSAEDKANCESNVKPCYKDNRYPVTDEVAQDWYYYTSMTGTITAVDENGSPLNLPSDSTGPDWFLPGSCDLDWTGFYPQIGLGANDKTADFGGAVWFVCRNESNIELGDGRTHMDFNFNLERGNCDCPVEDPDVGNPIDPFEPSIPVFYDPVGCFGNVEDDVVVDGKGWACRKNPSSNTVWGMWAHKYKGSQSTHFSLEGEGQIFVGDDNEALIFRGTVKAPDDQLFPFILEYHEPKTISQCNNDPDLSCPTYPGDARTITTDEGESIPLECDASENNWQYYKTVTGLIQIPGPEGTTINCSITGKGGAAQIGVGANQHSSKNGTSTWFNIDDEEDAEACGAIFEGTMDFNFNILDMCLDGFTPIEPFPICVDRFDAKEPTNKGHFLWVREFGARYVPGEVEAYFGPNGLTMKGFLQQIGSNNKLAFDLQLSDSITHEQCLEKYDGDDYICGKPEQGGPQEVYNYYETVEGWVVSYEGAPNPHIDGLANSTCSFYQPEGKPLPQYGPGANAKDKMDHGLTWWVWCEQENVNEGHWGDFNIILDADCIPPPDPIFPCVAPLLPGCVTIGDEDNQCTNANRICVDGSCERKNCANARDPTSSADEQAQQAQDFCDDFSAARGPLRQRYCDIDDARCRVKRNYNRDCESNDQCLSGLCNDNGKCGCDGTCANTNQFCNGDNVCERKFGPGDECSEDGQCRSDICEETEDESEVESGVCGCDEASTDPNDPQCNANQFCSDNGLCEKKLGLKKECENDDQCASGICDGTCKCMYNWQCGKLAYCDTTVGTCKRPQGAKCPETDEEQCDSLFCNEAINKCGCDENSPTIKGDAYTVDMQNGCPSVSANHGLVPMTCNFDTNKCVVANCGNTMLAEGADADSQLHYEMFKCDEATEYCNVAKRKCMPKLGTWAKCQLNSDCASDVCQDQSGTLRCGCTVGDQSTCSNGKVCRADHTCQICDTEVDHVDAECADGKYCNIWMSETRAYCKNKFNVGIFCDETKGGDDECKSGVCRDNQCRCTPHAGDCGNKACHSDGLCRTKLGKNKECVGPINGIPYENECKSQFECRCEEAGKTTKNCPTVPKCLTPLP